MAKTALRMGGNEITHILFTTINGVNHYLTKEDRDRMHDISEEDIEIYYSGDDHDEVKSLKEDISSLMTGELSLEAMKLRVAMHNGIIQDKILEISN